MAQLPPQDGANSFSQKVCLFLACSDLIGKDFNSKSDPFVAVYLKDNKSKDFKYVDRTETIDDNHYPKFNKELTFDYSFEKEQILRFDVYDDDNKKEPLNFAKHDFIGSCTMSLGEIVHAQGLTLTKKLLKRGKELKNKKSKMYARLTCTLEIINPNLKDEMITFQFKASNLPKMDGLFGKSDPFFEIIRINPSNNLKIVVYKSETIMNNLNPQWKDFNIALSKLCNFDESMKLTIIVYDYDGKGNTAEEIGQATATFKDLKECPELFLTRPHKAKDVNKTFGKLKIAKCSARSLNKDEIQSNYTFLDYLQGGTEISMMLAIDFTGSNLDPSLQKSLHYIDRQYGAPSKYQQAIRSLGNILSNYDSDQKFPCWTFGIWFRPGPNEQNVAKMDYPLNGNYQNNEVNGIYSIETHYLNLINQIASQSHLQPNAKTIALSGPTNISPILNKAKNFASQAHARNKQGNNAQYYVLLILTDGAITDMKETKDAIIDMANKGLPISIIIVGITFDNNNQNVFEAMEELDADKGPLLNSFGQKAQRDIVQFVEFNKYANNPHQLAAKTLEEIPKQFMDYMNLNKLKPGAKTQIPKNYEQQFALDDNIINRDDTVMIDYQNVKQDKNGIVNNKQYDDMPLPQGWERAYDENGNTYYVDHNTHTTHWDPPIIGIAKNNQKQEEKQQDQKQQQQPQQQQQQLQQQPQQQLQQQPQQQQQQLQQQPQQQQQYQQPQQQQYQQQWAPQQQQQWIPQQQQQWAPQQQWGQQQPQQQWGQQQWAPQQQWGQQQPQQQWAQQQPQQQQWVQQQQGGQQQGGQQQGGQQQGGQQQGGQH